MKISLKGFVALYSFKDLPYILAIVLKTLLLGFVGLQLIILTYIWDGCYKSIKFFRKILSK